MTHDELVDVAVAWLRRGVEYQVDGTVVARRRYTLALGEIVTAASETPDAIGFTHGISCVIECKVSRSDFFADRAKPHMHDETCGMGRFRWYLTPPGLVGAEEVPSWCGLAYAKARRVEVVKLAPMRHDIHARATMNENIVACSAARRFQLGVAFDVKRGRFAPVETEART